MAARSRVQRTKQLTRELDKLGRQLMAIPAPARRETRAGRTAERRYERIEQQLQHARRATRETVNTLAHAGQLTARQLAQLRRSAPDLTPPARKEVSRKTRRTRERYQGVRLDQLGGVHRMKGSGWWDRYSRDAAHGKFSKKWENVPAHELRTRTLFERIRDLLESVPPEQRDKLVLNIRSGRLGKETVPTAAGGDGARTYGRKGIMVRVGGADMEAALQSIPQLLYTAGLRNSPRVKASQNEPETEDIEIRLYLETDDIDYGDDSDDDGAE